LSATQFRDFVTANGTAAQIVLRGDANEAAHEKMQYKDTTSLSR
jgi:hypothetical protein